MVSGPLCKLVIKKKEITAQSIANGFRRFTAGLTKKVIIANQLSTLVNAAFDIHCKLSTPLAWLSSIAFMLQLYYDFSGYSDMAIGIGTMIGFEIPENFNYPYSSHSIQEFWQRWHMSLGLWFKDYVYIPLGGNRVSKVRWIINTMIVWSLTVLSPIRCKILLDGGRRRTKIYMVFLREPSRRDRSGSDLFHLRDGFEIKMNFDRNVSCFIFVNALMHDDFFD